MCAEENGATRMPQNTTLLAQHLDSVVSENVARRKSADAAQTLKCGYLQLRTIKRAA